MGINFVGFFCYNIRMKNFIDLRGKDNLHHAYAIEGDKKAIIPELYSFLENDLKIVTKANPDFYFNEFESFGIDSGRELQDQASRKAMQGNMRIFVITISSITSEAQNALLKLFEEPAEGVHFFIIVQSSEIFLPTLRSRFNILHQGKALAENNALVDEFMKASKTDRMKLLEGIIEEYKENKNKEKALDILYKLYDKYGIEYSGDIFHKKIFYPKYENKKYKHLQIPLTVVGSPPSVPIIEYLHANQKDVVENAKKEILKNELAIMYGHPIFEGVKIKFLTEIFKFVKSEGYKVMTLSEIADYYKEKGVKHNKIS